MKKNDIFEATCIDLSHDGLGIVKSDNFVYFVKGLLPNEKARLKVIKMLKNYGVARVEELYTKSKYRQVPPCSVFKQCGGCHYQHLTIEGQKQIKTKRVKDTLERIGNCFVEVEDTIEMDNPWYYRNKVQMPVGIKNNQIVSGFYKAKTNEIIPCDNCLIQNELSNQIILDVVKLLNKYHINPYSKETKTGNIKHILTKYSNKTKEIMLVFISYQDKIKHLDDIIKDLVIKYPNLTTVIQNINKRHDNVILGDEEIIHYGKGYIIDSILGNDYKISLKSFYQVNPIQVEVLYKKAIDFAELKKSDVVLDAYCGIGTITLSLAKYVDKVYGVEVVEQAIIDAKDNAKLNDINNVEFKAADAGKYMAELVDRGINLDVVFVDPPRKGCSNEFLDYLIKANPEKIVYISCNVATQARDIKILQEANYQVLKCQPVDMFPQTNHVETVVLLSKAKT